MTLRLGIASIALKVTTAAILWVTRGQTAKKHRTVAAQRPRQRSAHTQLHQRTGILDDHGSDDHSGSRGTDPHVDEHGHRQFVIRTRTLETVLGPVGPTERERERRHTLPGQRHVIPLSDTEFAVFHGHVKLHLDLDALHPT